MNNGVFLSSLNFQMCGSKLYTIRKSWTPWDIVLQVFSYLNEECRSAQSSASFTMISCMRYLSVWETRTYPSNLSNFGIQQKLYRSWIVCTICFLLEAYHFFLKQFFLPAAYPLLKLHLRTACCLLPTSFNTFEQTGFWDHYLTTCCCQEPLEFFLAGGAGSLFAVSVLVLRMYLVAFPSLHPLCINYAILRWLHRSLLVDSFASWFE